MHLYCVYWLYCQYIVHVSLCSGCNALYVGFNALLYMHMWQCIYEVHFYHSCSFILRHSTWDGHCSILSQPRQSIDGLQRASEGSKSFRVTEWAAYHLPGKERVCGWHGTCLLYLVMHCVSSEQKPSLTCINHITPMRCTLPAGVSICTGLVGWGRAHCQCHWVTRFLINSFNTPVTLLTVRMKVPVYLRVRRIKSACVPG